MLEVRHLGAAIEGHAILHDVSFTLPEHGLLMVVGPNGAGKTTMVRAIMNILPHTGRVLLDGQLITTMLIQERARRIGVLTQQNTMSFAYTVREVVAVGRYAHRLGIFASLTRKDKEAVDRAMDLTDSWKLRDRFVTTLSGGELQRVYLARALAQDPTLLILDEPVNHLDIEHQIMLFNIIVKWIVEPGHAAMMIVHDLNLAYYYGTQALLLQAGHVLASGAPGQVFNRENLMRAYNVDFVTWMQNLLNKWQ